MGGGCSLGGEACVFGRHSCFDNVGCPYLHEERLKFGKDGCAVDGERGHIREKGVGYISLECRFIKIDDIGVASVLFC